MKRRHFGLLEAYSVARRLDMGKASCFLLCETINKVIFSCRQVGKAVQAKLDGGRIIVLEEWYELVPDAVAPVFEVSIRGVNTRTEAHLAAIFVYLLPPHV